MTRTAAAIAVAAFMVSGAAMAQPAPPTRPQGAELPNAGHTLAAPPYEQAPMPSPSRQRRPVFTIFNMPVVVRAPMQPTYDSRDNQDAAANPFWLDEGNPM